MTYSQLSASAIVTTTYIAPGTVYASGIQTRWSGPFPLIQHQGLSPGAKAGIGVSVIAVLFIAAFVAWLLSRRYKRRSTYDSSRQPSWEAQYPGIGKGELPG